MPPENDVKARDRMREVGLNPNRWNNRVIVAEALSRGIEVHQGAHPRRVLLKLNGQEHFWQQGYTSLNTVLARRCVHLKDVSSRLLRSRGVNAPENNLFSSSDPDRAWAWATSIAPVVVKPLNGRQGTDIYTNINSHESLTEVFGHLASKYDELLVEKFQRGSDYRVLVVNGKFVAATNRIAAHVIGDGKHNISNLIDSRNASRPKNHKKILKDDISQFYLNERGLSYEDVPGAGELVVLRGAANRSAGGDVIDATDELSPSEKRMAEQAVRSIPGLNSAGLDILLPRGEGDSPACVIELNSSPNISPHHFPARGQRRDAASAVIDAMFPETA